MNKLIALYDHSQVLELSALLDGAGIEFYIKDETSSSMGEIVPFANPVHFFINHEKDLETAKNILDQMQNDSSALEDLEWVCVACDEVNESQFTACWKCSNDRPD